ncbi:transcription factor HES-7.1-A-like [Astyanax mexicanus]|uniref:Transcription factor HES-7.1-A-like n=1 Tax=Astyanax mexicanus TaxID=7994 RepID=A0A8T2MAT3_ASTMX|nr:transcription factor HES-7.1-A-like [Astyanax mexicanus]
MTTDLWNNTPAMSSLEDSTRLKMDRKLLKPQVERRRRERMNKSLESLRTLLLQSPEALSQRRVEKAEILEHTVLFLQNSTTQTKQNQDWDETSERRQFMDGFSACLQQAALFLQTEGEARGLQASLSASLCQRLSHPHHVPAAGTAGTTGTAPNWAKISSRAANASEKKVSYSHGLESTRKTSPLSHPYSLPPRHTHSASLAHRHRDSHATSSPATGHACGQQVSVGQGVWRPWP